MTEPAAKLDDQRLEVADSFEHILQASRQEAHTGEVVESTLTLGFDGLSRTRRWR